MIQNIRRCMAAFLCILLTVSGGVQSFAKENTLTLYARSAVLMDGESGRILYGKESDEELPMASTTKIMTCIIALENGTPDLICEASSRAVSQPEVRLGMVSREQFYLKDLLYSLMLESHNDTAVCIAEAVAGSVEAFTAMMNEKARQIGCTQTHYVTPNGLDAEDEAGTHHTTAAELALVLRYCLSESGQREAFLEITQTQSYSFTDVEGRRSFDCTNHNAFLQLMDGALSGKTGFTAKAGYCYVGALRRDDHFLIVALLACGWPGNKGYKWIDTRKLMNYGLEEFERVDLAELADGSGQQQIRVLQGRADAASVEVMRPEHYYVLMNKAEKAEYALQLLPVLAAPVAQNTVVGTLRCRIGADVLAAWPVVANETVDALDYKDCVSYVAGWFLR